MAPFQYQNYQSPYANSIASLMLRSGEISAQAAEQIGNAQANAALQRGQAWSGAVERLGQIPQQIQAARTAGLQSQHLAAQTADLQAQAAQRGQAAQQAAAVAKQNQMIDQIMQQSMKPNAETGVVTFDRPAFEQSLVNAGIGHLYPQLAETLDKLDASASKRNAEGRMMLAQTLFGIQQSGYAPAAVLSGAAYLKANNLVTADHLQPALQAIAANPTPETVKSIVDDLGRNLPEYRQLVDADAKRQAEIAKTSAETQKATAEAAKIWAEVAGTLPPTSAQAETARHNAEMERIAKLTQGREAARDAEIARHNRETEKAANPLASLVGGAPQATGTQQPQTISGDAFLKTLPDSVAAQVKALAEGRMPFPSGMALKTPYWQGMITAVTQYDPSFDAVNYNARANTRKDFTSGKAAQQVNALNTVLGHLNGLSDAAEALNNTDYPLLNSVLNTLSKAVGRSNVTNFNTIKKAVADEVTRVWRQAGGSVEDVRQAQENLSAASSPEQLRGAIATYGELLQSKLGSLQDQYRQGMGTAPVNMLRPENQVILDKIQKRAGSAAPAGSNKNVEQWERGPDGKLHRVGG